MRTHPRGRRRLVALALAALSLVAISPAIAATHHARTHTLQIKTLIHAHPVLTSGNVSTISGATSDPRLGQGAAVYTVTYPARTFTFVQYGVHGTMHGNGRIDAGTTPNPDGTISLSGPVKVTGGTGDYKGAHGTLQLSGTTTAAFDDTLTVTGKVVVPVPVPVKKK
jgi:hypothetical protein